MDKKVKKIWDIAIKHIPGPSNNPGIKYHRTKLAIDIIIEVYPLIKQPEAIQILKDQIERTKNE